MLLLRCSPHFFARQIVSEVRRFKAQRNCENM